MSSAWCSSKGAFYDGDRDALIRRAREAMDGEGFAAFAHRHFGAMLVEGSDPRLRERVLARVANVDPALSGATFTWRPSAGIRCAAGKRCSR